MRPPLLVLVVRLVSSSGMLCFVFAELADGIAPLLGVPAFEILVVIKCLCVWIAQGVAELHIL